VTRGTEIGDMRVKVEKIGNENSAKMRDTRVRCRSEEKNQGCRGRRSG
jgi:hypothetical protein